MFSKSNLAFAKYNSYNCEKDEIIIQKLLTLKFGNNNYLSLTKKSLIMRENILASGMEPVDIDKAYEITKIIQGGNNLEDNNELQMLEEELYGINNAVSKAQERLNIVVKTETLLTSIQNILISTKIISSETYNTKYNQITDNITNIKELASKIQYEELNEFNKDELIPQGAISYNFQSINYNSLVMALPKAPPLTKDELNNFIQELEFKHSNVLLQVSQLKSYKKKLELIIDNLSITALACYLCS